MSDFLRPHGLYSPWNSPGQNTGVGSLTFLQGIFPTQGSNPGLLHKSGKWLILNWEEKGNKMIKTRGHLRSARAGSEHLSWPRSWEEKGKHDPAGTTLLICITQQHVSQTAHNNPWVDCQINLVGCNQNSLLNETEYIRLYCTKLG